MKVVNNRIISLEQDSDSVGAPGGNLVCLATHSAEGERDGRGLVIALLLCVTCWAALGYFLLT